MIRAVKGLIVKDGKFLLLLKQNGRQDLPGGRCEKDEGLDAALVREVFEETGLKVRPIKIISAHEAKIEDDVRHFTTFLCEQASGSIKLSGEHSGYKWVMLDEKVEDWIRDVINDL